MTTRQIHSILTSVGTGLTLCLALAAQPAQAQQTAPGVVGKDGWLFYNHEFVRDPAQAQISVDLIARVSKALQANGTTLLVAIAPIKARIYAAYLPASHPMKPEHDGDYNRLLSRLQAAGVATVDINSAFLTSPKRSGEFPLYFRQDTHWSATGALLAAETIRDTIQATPALKRILDATPTTAHSLTWATQQFPVTGDLVQQLPPGAPKYEKEMATAFDVRKTGGSASLLGNTGGSGVVLLGSSYSADWTHFPKAVSHALQRDVAALAITADRGQWVGLDTYLRNDAFQLDRPKLLIWEMPERDLKAPPNMPYRDARYVFDNEEWVARVGALISQTCTPSNNSPTVTGKLAQGQQANATSTGAADAVEVTLSRTSAPSEYLAGMLTTNGSKSVSVELSGAGVPSRQFTLDVAGDEQAHTIRIPLYSKAKGFTKIKISPGNTRGFTLKDVAVCTQPQGLLN